jgi:hypothetical protein
VKHPSSELVAQAWLETLGLTADSIGSSLPADPATWAAGGYVQVTTISGAPAVHVEFRRPTVQIDCWCTRLDSEQVPWNRAGDLAGQIVDATYAMTGAVNVVLPAGYRPVRVHNVFPRSEPRRVSGDPAGYARVMVDLTFAWSWSE